MIAISNCVTFLKQTLSEIPISKLKTDSKEFETEIKELKSQILSEKLKLKTQSSKKEANKLLVEFLRNNLEKVRNIRQKESAKCQQLEDFEKDKIEFIDLIFSQLCELNKTTKKSKRRTIANDHLNDLLNTFDRNDSSNSNNFVMANKPSSDLFDKTLLEPENGRTSLPLNETTSSRNNDNDSVNIDIYNQRERRFSRKPQPDASMELKRGIKNISSPSRMSDMGVKRELGDVGSNWLNLVKEMSNFVQFITKTSSIFANTISFFMGKFPKEGQEANSVRASIIKFVYQIYE